MERYNKKQKHIQFYILYGSDSDISKIDFSPYNIKCLKFNLNEFHEIYKDTAGFEDSEYLKKNLKKIQDRFNRGEELFVLLPLNFLNYFDEKYLILCFDLLLILFPCRIQIVNILAFQLYDDNLLQLNSNSSFDLESKDYYDYLYFDENSLEEINNFIVLFKERKNSIAYIRTTINAYVNSFQERRIEMEFLNLCISLESVVDGQQELSYRIKRNVSVLCGNNKQHAEKVFYNLTLIYNLRSNIVHAGTFKQQKLLDYLPYLRNLVSRLIIELILQNIHKLDELNRRLTSAGFGDKHALNEGSDYGNMLTTLINYSHIKDDLLIK